MLNGDALASQSFAVKADRQKGQTGLAVVPKEPGNVGGPIQHDSSGVTFKPYRTLLEHLSMSVEVMGVRGRFRRRLI